MMRANNLWFHVEESGDPAGLPVVFSNSLGTDLRIWDGLLSHLPSGLRIVRYDTRGHGLSACPAPPYGMGELVDDAAAILDVLGVAKAVFVGLSIGGMIGQGLSAERPDLVRALVMMDTATKIGTEEMWQDRIEAITAGGIEALADQVLQRWFSRAFLRDRQAELVGWRNMLTRTPADGYIGCAAAIASTDLWESTSRLRLPAVAIVGAEDGSTPPDLMRETADLVPGCRTHVIPGVGHLPGVENPQAVSAILSQFMRDLP